MIEPQIKKRLMVLCSWLALLIILASCSPWSTMPTSEPASKPITRIQPNPALPRSTAEASAQICQVKTGMPSGYLNLRAGAGVEYEVIRVLSEGETLQVIKRSAWLEVIDEQGNQGFINSRYCR